MRNEVSWAEKLMKFAEMTWKKGKKERRESDVEVSRKMVEADGHGGAERKVGTGEREVWQAT